VIPKTHDLGFCFIATASTLKGLGLMFAPQTVTVCPTASSSEIQKRNSYACLLIQGIFTIAPSSYPDLPIFLRRCSIANFGVRLYVSIVRVGQ